MHHDTCKHFNGIQHAECKAGVNYKDRFPDGKRPCIQVLHMAQNGGTLLRPGQSPYKSEPFPDAQGAPPCQHYQEPTAEEVQKWREDRATFLKAHGIK